jgi:MFS family permease
VQGVTGRTATEAGQVLTPVFLGWVGTSVVAARLLLRIGYRTTTVIGVVLVAAAFVCFARMDGSTGRLALLTAAFVLGAGMGFSMLSLLLATQHAVPRAELGLATSMNQFSRSIGAAIGVALMGAVLSFGLGPGAAVHLQAAAATGAFTFSPALGEHLASALHLVFGLGALIAALAFLPALALRPLDFDTSLPHDAGEQLLAAEMTSIDEDCEPAPARQPGESRQARSVSE